MLLVSSGGPAWAQAPTGLAAAALAHPAFEWIQRSTPGFRVHFLAGSYPAQHQDSLLARLAPAARHAESLLQVPALAEPIDLFFIESREQMTKLIGGRATGFAEPATRTVLLVTNPTWRGFERHEIMHVIAGQAWGRPGPGTDWLMEGLAQAADGRCGGFSNADVLAALATRRGWIPFPTLFGAFRTLPDLRAYLHAAAFSEHLLRRFGPGPVRELWTRGTTAHSTLAGRSLVSLEQEWRMGLHRPLHPDAVEVAAIEAKGCG